MILQALVKLYEDLAAQGKIARPGWSAVKVRYALCLDSTGGLTQVIPLLEEQQKGNKTVSLPRSMNLPAQVKRTVGVAANFLCDNSGYLLGVDDKGKPARTRQCFDACRLLHETILDGVDSPAARAILAYFESWQPGAAPPAPRSERLPGGADEGGQSGVPGGGALCPRGFCHSGRLAATL